MAAFYPRAGRLASDAGKRTTIPNYLKLLAGFAAIEGGNRLPSEKSGQNA
jgi:hypothetical protein